jgi:hypothetical protein
MMYSQIADARERHGHHPIIPVQGIEIRYKNLPMIFYCFACLSQVNLLFSGAEGRQESESAGDGPHFTEPQVSLKTLQIYLYHR